MEYLHTMVRVRDLDESLDFYCQKLGLRYIFGSGKEYHTPLLELTYNWDTKEYSQGRNFGHLAFRVDNIYQLCTRLLEQGVTINRPPKDGYMAFVRSPDGISIELLQKGEALEPCEPWASMKNNGEW